jgi:hypothetical protein
MASIRDTFDRHRTRRRAFLTNAALIGVSPIGSRLLGGLVSEAQAQATTTVIVTFPTSTTIIVTFPTSTTVIVTEPTSTTIVLTTPPFTTTGLTIPTSMILTSGGSTDVPEPSSAALLAVGIAAAAGLGRRLRARLSSDEAGQHEVGQDEEN